MNKILVLLLFILTFNLLQSQEVRYSECRKNYESKLSRSDVLKCFLTVFNNNKNLIVRLDSARYITSICLEEAKKKNYTTLCNFSQSITIFEEIKSDDKFFLYYEAKYYAAISYYTNGKNSKDVKQLDSAIEYMKDVLEHRDKLIDTPPFLIYIYIANSFYYKSEYQNFSNFYFDIISALEEANKLTNDQKYKIAIEKIMYNTKRNFADSIIKKCKNSNEDNACDKCDSAREMYKDISDKTKYSNIPENQKDKNQINNLESVCKKTNI